MGHIGNSTADCLAFSVHAFTHVHFDEFIALFLFSCTTTRQCVQYFFLVVIH